MELKSYFSRKNIFLFGLVLLAVGIPLSRFLISVAQLLLLGNWLLEGNFKSKWQTIRSSKALLSYIAIFLFFVTGMFWSSDTVYGIQDLRIKLPMLWLPILFFTTPKLTRREYHAVLGFFVVAVVVASCWSMIVYSGLTKIQVRDIRDISRFESHIRFSLMIVLAIVYLGFLIVQPQTKTKVLYVAVLLWLCTFLVILQAFTGLAILAIIAVIALGWMLFSTYPRWSKLTFSIVIVAAIGFLGNVVREEWKKIHEVTHLNLSTLPTFTKSGRWYYHDTSSRLRENGNLVWITIMDVEMKQEWNKRSSWPYDSLDQRGNPIRFTMTRYLASKNLTRDSAGIASLSEKDIRNIETGYPNYRYTSKTGLRTRMHELLWEVEQAQLDQNPSGHSLTMRLEFWKTACHIIRKNLLFGVGTGDVDLAFKQQYQDDHTRLPTRWQLRAHNQFLAVTVALGVTGLIVFLCSFLSPLLFNRRNSRFFIFFILIQFLSFLDEDTLETQAGVTFCVFFTQFLFHYDEYNL